ncbi:hypothetical protein [Poseidonocella sp. HB161398]|uniref:hypothetical protein n=1 Tax=Poseidonocella sp. HB161398 TaxID=2320855 RepID=UPI001108CBFE|nr:hypothetical protein [Poseidonocella sp. HB161398]
MAPSTLRDAILIHPGARAAFDCIAALLPASPIGAPRAVRQGGTLLVFAGFAGIGRTGGPAPAIEHGLSETEIEAAAWAEAAAIWKLLTASPAAQRDAAEALAAAAPANVLRDLGLPESRDPKSARKQLRLSATDRNHPAFLTIHERCKAAYNHRHGLGTVQS